MALTANAGTNQQTIAPGAANFSSKHSKANPRVTPKCSLGSRILGALGWGTLGMAIGGAVGGGLVLGFDLFMNIGQGFCGAGLIGAAAGAVYGATHKASRGDLLSNASNLDADPNAAKIKNVLSQAHSASGDKAQALLDQASKLATRGCRLHRQTGGKEEADPMPC